MILGKVKIQNFKSIIDTGDIYLSKGDLINILAGQNESGKTAFLRALRFFEEGNYDDFEDEDRRMEKSPRVDCTFYLTDDEHNALESETNKKVADHFKKNGFTFVRGNADKDDFDSLKYLLYPHKEIITKYNESLKKSTAKQDSESAEETEEIEEFNPYSYFSEIRPKLIFYSSFSDNILPGKIMYSEIDSNQAVQDFQSVYNVDFKKLLESTTPDQERTREEERVRREAADSLNSYWNQTISGEEVEYKFAISVKNNNSDINQSYINFFINQGDEPQLSVSQKSQGFQWFVGFNLRLRAHENELADDGLILLIDEPGQGLHEQAQEDVKDVIEELARNSKMQIIYSTHQPILLGKEKIDFSKLLLVDRTKENGSQFKTISQLISSNGNKDALAPVKSALGLISIKNLSNTKLNVLVEGITEYFYFKTLFEDKFIIIPSAGVDQVPNIYSILLGWGINTKIIVDGDTQGKKVFNKIKKEFFDDQLTNEFKKIVMQISDADGIEDLLSVKVITSIMFKYGKKYNSKKSKIENVKEVGKFIFAKSFFDEYVHNISKLDEETIKQFREIEKFLN